MGASKTNGASAGAWALAESQQGLITRRQLLMLGFSTKAIVHRLARGRLHSVARGVYAVGWAQMTPKRRWMAAVLTSGEGAALSHRSAGALWGIVAERGTWVDVSVPRRVHSRRPKDVRTGRERRQGSGGVAIRVRSRPALTASECTSRDGIPVTAVVRTLLDLATELGPFALERAVNEADKRDLISPPRLRAALDRYGGRPGVRALRRILAPETFRLSDSDLEILFGRVAARVGLPSPLSRQFVNNFEVDFFWPDLGLVVETDGLRYHRTPSEQARDHLRDQTHVASGLTTLRFTHWQVTHEPGHVEDVLRRTAAHL